MACRQTWCWGRSKERREGKTGRQHLEKSMRHFKSTLRYEELLLAVLHREEHGDFRVLHPEHQGL